MDFGYLLDLAKKNEEYAKEAVQVKRYSTQVSASKKEPRTAIQSDSIRKFLARKEDEERQKRRDALEKKEKLLSLRSQDRKANARVQHMLKRTKSANKGVLNEQSSLQHTAVTAAGLDAQPDEDDYGYVSHEASEFYKKFLDKYNSGPSTDSGEKQTRRSQSELINAKDRVKDALHKLEEEEGQHQPRKRRTKKNLVTELPPPPPPPPSSSSSSSDKKAGADREAVKKNRPKGAAAAEAALSFDQILKLAATKQHQPVKLEASGSAHTAASLSGGGREKKGAEPSRLMTKKEKEDHERHLTAERQRQLRKEGKLPPLNAAPPPPPPSSSSSSSPPSAAGHPSGRTAKDSRDSRDAKNPAAGAKGRPVAAAAAAAGRSAGPAARNSPSGSSESRPAPKAAAAATAAGSGRPSSGPSSSAGTSRVPAGASSGGPSGRPLQPKAKGVAGREPPPAASKAPPSRAGAGRPQQQQLAPRPSTDAGQSRPARPDMAPAKGKTLASAGSRPFPAYRDGVRPPAHPHRPGPAPSGKRRLESDSEEEEHDSELDDFIDDGPEEGANDYSKYIQEIFGARYRRIVSDDEDENDCMETSYAAQMREERISTRLGIMEDLEDMQREEDEKKMKMARMAKKAKRK